MFKQSYTQEELDKIISNTSVRNGWDFSCMKTERETVPWNYLNIVKHYLKSTDKVLDIGTGGGENFIKLAPYFKSGVGIDIDPKMISIANKNGEKVDNVRFYVDSEKLNATEKTFDVILNRHAPFNFEAINRCLNTGGFFITQQVGEKNMYNIKKALNYKMTKPVITRKQILNSGLTMLEFKEYNVKYIVKDIKSFVFWLKALDMLHADIQTDKIITKSDILNNILKDKVIKKGFITNEHRYLVVAQKL